MEFLKRKIPPISKTEREAIEAGHTWWEKELFCGRPDWQKLLNYPKPTLSSEELSFLNNQVEQLCSMLNDWKIVYEEHNLPENVWSYLKKEKFFGLIIPKEYGGLGFSALAQSSIITKIATRSTSAAVNTMVPNTLGPGELLLHYGTEAQKQQFLPRLANGEEIPCFALTGPEAGSDAGSIPDTGVVCYGMHQGKETLGIRLSWNKRYITLAPMATLLGLAIHLYDPDHLIGKEDDVGITLCLIPTSHSGVNVGTRHIPLLLAFMNGPTTGKDVFIPLDWIIGGAKMAGQGWRMLMESLSAGRAISLPALATAAGKLTYRYTGAYARLRRQFHVSISAFEGIEEALGAIAGSTYQLEACRVFTAGAVDQKIKPATASAIAKYHMTELARKVIAHALDIHAGHMIQAGPRNFLAFFHLGIPICITVEGANILTRNLIIFGQGAIRCHPYLLKEMEILNSPSPNKMDLFKVLCGHVGFFLRNISVSLAYGLTGGKLICSIIKNKNIKKYHKQLTRMSRALALIADSSLLLLGGSLKRRERISARLGDIMSQLYLASAVIKYYYDQNQPESDVDYVCWCLQECLYKVQIAIDEVLNNFPKRWIGKVLHAIVFPYGTAYRAPKDKLNKKIVASMISASELRDRLTQFCYIPKNEKELCYLLDKGIAQADQIDPLFKKIRAKTSLTSEEQQAIKEFEALVREVIKVNEFSFDLKTVIE